MEILVLLGVVMILSKCTFAVIDRVNSKSMERKFIRHYDGKYGKGSYKRASRAARQQRHNQFIH